MNGRHKIAGRQVAYDGKNCHHCALVLHQFLFDATKLMGHMTHEYKTRGLLHDVLIRKLLLMIMGMTGVGV